MDRRHSLILLLPILKVYLLVALLEHKTVMVVVYKDSVEIAV